MKQKSWGKSIPLIFMVLVLGSLIGLFSPSISLARGKFPDDDVTKIVFPLLVKNEGGNSQAIQWNFEVY